MLRPPLRGSSTSSPALSSAAISRHGSRRTHAAASSSASGRPSVSSQIAAMPSTWRRASNAGCTVAARAQNSRAAAPASQNRRRSLRRRRPAPARPAGTRCSASRRSGTREVASTASRGACASSVSTTAPTPDAPSARCSQLSSTSRRRDYAQRLRHLLQRVGLRREPEQRRDAQGHLAGRRQVVQVGPQRAVGEARASARCHLAREAGLADAARPCQRHEPSRAALQRIEHAHEFLLAADQRVDGVCATRRSIGQCGRVGLQGSGDGARGGVGLHAEFLRQVLREAAVGAPRLATAPERCQGVELGAQRAIVERVRVQQPFDQRKRFGRRRCRHRRQRSLAPLGCDARALEREPVAEAHAGGIVESGRPVRRAGALRRLPAGPRGWRDRTRRRRSRPATAAAARAPRARRRTRGAARHAGRGAGCGDAHPRRRAARTARPARRARPSRRVPPARRAAGTAARARTAACGPRTRTPRDRAAAVRWGPRTGGGRLSERGRGESGINESRTARTTNASSARRGAGPTGGA